MSPLAAVMGMMGSSSGFGDAHGIEHAGGVLATAHHHAAGARDLKDAVVAFVENLDETFDLGGDAGQSPA